MPSDPIAFSYENLIMTHDGIKIECPDCTGQHLLARYLKHGCGQYEDPKRPILIYPRGSER